MSERPLSWFILVFTFLEFVVRTQLTAHDNSHGFISYNHDRYLGNDLAAMQEELAADIRRTASMTKLNLKLQLKFEPEFLDFKQRPLGVPHLEKVTLFNIDRNKTLDMTSISGNTVHFHSSFFEDKKIPPLGNTTFNVVFLGREEGSVESNLFIHTTDGHFKYHVKGASIYSPYRLRPIVGIKLPLMAPFAPLIHLYNPFLEPIQIVEIYSSGGDFHLELPTGELEGPKDMWEIPPLQSKAIIKVRFFARSEQNHTAYVRIKLNNTNDILVVPLEVEVTPNALLFALQGYLDFGVGGSLDPPKELKLRLSNPLKQPTKIHSITCSSKAIKIEYLGNAKTAKNDLDTMVIAKLRLNWKTAFDTKDHSGKIVIRYKNSKIKTEIPYFVTVVEGGLTYNASNTRYYTRDKPEKINSRKMVIKNDFLTPIMLTNVTLTDEASKFFHVSDFAPHVMKQGEEKAIFTLKLNTGVALGDVKVNTHILLNTNISSFEVPLVSYDGKFELKLPYKSKDNSLDLGLIGLEGKKECYLLLANRNPVTITMKKLTTSLPSSTVELVGCSKGGYRTALLHESYYNMTKCIHVKGGEYAVLKLAVKSGRTETQIWGDVAVQTQYEQLSVPVHFKVALGKLEIGPDRLVFDQCFPGKICSHPLRVHSTFTDPMVIEDILSIPPDPRISSQYSGQITARSSKVVGHLYLDPNIECQNECYLGLQEENYANWLRTLSLAKSTTEFDLNLVNILYNRYLNQTSNGLTRWQNLTMRLDTSEVKGHLFKTRVKMSWPSLLLDHSFENKSIVTFPLTQVGNVSFQNITIKNPSSHDLMLQIVLDFFYPNFDVLFEGLPPAFVPNHPEPLRKLKHGFFLELDSKRDFDSFMVHEESIQTLLKPNEIFTLKIGFKASDALTNSAFVFLRNNLTVMEILHLNAKGAHPSFKFGNRKPGSTQPLVFELTEKHLKDCEADKAKKYSPTLTVKRSFTARNTGDVPVFINGFFINSLPCEGYGFKVLNCEPIELPPNGTRKIDIAFTPDFTLAKITRMLVLETSLNYRVNYTLVTTVPSYYLSLCSNILPRPTWEYHLYYITVGIMVILLILVFIAPLLESERIIKDSMDVIPNKGNSQHTLDLRLIGAQTRTEIHSQKLDPDNKGNTLDGTDLKQEEKHIKQEPEKYTAVVPTIGKSRKKGSRKVCDVGEQEARKKNWIETHKIKNEEIKEQEKKCPKKAIQPKKPIDVKPPIEVPAYEEETSSTTTESSNNEEIIKNKPPVKLIEVKDVDNTHNVKLERKKPVKKESRQKENRVVQEAQKPEAKPKSNRKDRRDKQNIKKLSIEKIPKQHSESPNSTSPSIRVSPSFQSSIWNESKASFSDVVARSDSAPPPMSPAKPLAQIQTAKPTMYVEPYKQQHHHQGHSSELGPIGSRKLDMWQNNAASNPASNNSSASEEYNSFFTEAHNLAVESSNAFLEIGSPPQWQRNSSPMLNYIRNNNSPTHQADPWLSRTSSNSSSPWNDVPYSGGNASVDMSAGAAASSSANGYLWGSSPVWQPWSPAEPPATPVVPTPRTPTRTPPGFAPHTYDDEEMQRRQQQQQQGQMAYNPFGLSTIWTQHQQRNPWNYPQGQ